MCYFFKAISEEKKWQCGFNFQTCTPKHIDSHFFSILPGSDPNPRRQAERAVA